MREFSLSRASEKAFPTSIQDANGKSYKVNPDFRNVLKCLRVLEDESIPIEKRQYLLARWFFCGNYVREAVPLFMTFVLRGAKEEARDDKKTMDFEQDADAIYASFLQAYGIDLTGSTPLHWYKFIALLNVLPEETALMRRIALREMDTSKLKGIERAKAEEAKRRVALDDEPLSDEEKRIIDEIDRKLGNPSEEMQRRDEA